MWVGASAGGLVGRLAGSVVVAVVERRPDEFAFEFNAYFVHTTCYCAPVVARLHVICCVVAIWFVSVPVHVFQRRVSCARRHCFLLFGVVQSIHCYFYWSFHRTFVQLERAHRHVTRIVVFLREGLSPNILVAALVLVRRRALCRHVL